MEKFIINYGLIYFGIIITLIAQIYIKVTYNKYSNIRNNKKLTGYDIARLILDNNNLSDVKVLKIGGLLTDHYDPRSKVIKLSDNIFSSDSIASIAVAAHECGHAIQDKVGYFPLRLRSFIVPIVNIASYLGYFAILIGVLASITNFIWFGIIMELVILLFQLITLPVEFNASHRALKQLKVLDNIDSDDCKAMLISAALTYVASVLTTLLQILRLVLVFTNRNDK